MRQRSAVTRLLTTLLAAWLAVMMTVPDLVHPCPMHSGAMATMATMDMGQPASMGHHHGAPSQAPGHDEGSRHHCTCPGTGCLTHAATLPAAPLSVIPAAVVAASAAPALSAAWHLPRAPQHRQPYPNGPPLLA